MGPFTELSQLIKKFQFDAVAKPGNTAGVLSMRSANLVIVGFGSSFFVSTYLVLFLQVDSPQYSPDDTFQPKSSSR